MQEHTKAHGMGQRKNKLYMYSPLGIMKNKIYCMEIEGKKAPKSKTQSNHTHT